jgi:4-amino-4-deoxy-L-arabinose transferase-like glycosyltransferase
MINVPSLTIIYLLAVTFISLLPLYSMICITYHPSSPMKMKEIRGERACRGSVAAGRCVAVHGPSSKGAYICIYTLICIYILIILLLFCALFCYCVSCRVVFHDSDPSASYHHLILIILLYCILPFYVYRISPLHYPYSYLILLMCVCRYIHLS